LFRGPAAVFNCFAPTRWSKEAMGDAIQYGRLETRKRLPPGGSSNVCHARTFSPNYKNRMVV